MNRFIILVYFLYNMFVYEIIVGNIPDVAGLKTNFKTGLK